MKSDITRHTIITFISLILVLSTVHAWTGPTTTPPNPNVDAPITVGSTSQEKTGGLWVGSLGITGKAIMLATTTDSDPDNTLVTKGYLNSKLSGVSGSSSSPLTLVGGRTVTVSMSASGVWAASTASCNTDEVVVSGGGSCGNGLLGATSPALAQNGWYASCYEGGGSPSGSTYALCMKRALNPAPQIAIYSWESDATSMGGYNGAPPCGWNSFHYGCSTDNRANDPKSYCYANTAFAGTCSLGVDCPSWVQPDGTGSTYVGSYGACGL